MHSAGFPLYAMKDGVVPSKNSAIFSAGISVDIPFGHFGKILPISGLVFKKGIVPILTIINENSTEGIKICLMNHTDSPHNVVNGDCIAQLVIQRYTVPRTLVSVEAARVINIK
jgi:dUTP pyrophosphatase